MLFYLNNHIDEWSTLLTYFWNRQKDVRWTEWWINQSLSTCCSVFFFFFFLCSKQWNAMEQLREVLSFSLLSSMSFEGVRVPRWSATDEASARLLHELKRRLHLTSQRRTANGANDVVSPPFSLQILHPKMFLLKTNWPTPIALSTLSNCCSRLGLRIYIYRGKKIWENLREYR